VERPNKEVVLVFNMNEVVKELQQQVSRKASLASSVADGREPQLSNPTKERVKGPVGRRLPTKKAQGSKAIPEDEDDVSAALREFRTAAKRVREAREADEKDEVDKKDGVSDMSRQGIVDPADFDRAWFFRVPSFSCHTTTTTTTTKGSKNEPTELHCENNNMSSSSNNNNNRDSVVVHNSTNEEVGLDGGGPDIGSREGSSDASEGSEKKQKRRFWKSRDFNCYIL